MSSGGLPRAGMDTVDVSAVVRDAAARMDRLLGAEVELEVQEGVQCRCDAALLTRAIENLLDNAAKHGARTRPISVDVQRRADHVLIRVHNFGEPIAREDIARIFEHGVLGGESTRRGDGWGIGLAVVKGFADVHNGKVEVESTREGGTTFLLRLPAVHGLP